MCQFWSLEASPEASLAHDNFLAVTRISCVFLCGILADFWLYDDDDDDDNNDDVTVTVTVIGLSSTNATPGRRPDKSLRTMWNSVLQKNSAVTERPRDARDVENYAKLLKIMQKFTRVD